MLAMQLRPDAFTPEQMARNFAYYEAVTVRDSSLSACTQAMVAARTGHLDLAYDYLAEAALVDLNNLAGNTDHGVHIASMAGTWNAVVAGFGGMEFDSSGLSFAPQLPAGAEQDQLRAGLAGPAAAGVDHRGRGGVPAGRRPADAPAPPRRAARAGRRPGRAPAAGAAARRPGRAAATGAPRRPGTPGAERQHGAGTGSRPDGAGVCAEAVCRRTLMRPARRPTRGTP